jgi:hypothetical protein
MKVLLTTAAMMMVTILATPSSAQMGMTAGSEARGEPLNSSVHASAREPGGYTPGARAHARAHVKKKRSHISTSGRASVSSSGR